MMDACFFEAFEFPAPFPLLLFSGVLTTGSGLFCFEAAAAEASLSASLSLSEAEAISFLVTMKPSSSRNVLLTEAGGQIMSPLDFSYRVDTSVAG